MGILSELIGRWQSRRRARKTAIRHFRETFGKSPIGSMTRVIATDADGPVVRVCYGPGRPPDRHWFRIGSDGAIVSLNWDEARRLGERPWR